MSSELALPVPAKRTKTLSDSSHNQEQPSSDASYSVGQNTAVEPDPAAVVALQRTYPYQDLEDLLIAKHHYIEVVPPHFASVVNVILTIEQSDLVIEIKKLSKRIYFYALAKLHPKGTSVDEIVERVQSALKHVKNIRSKVYNYLRIGSRWRAIIE